MTIAKLQKAKFIAFLYNRPMYILALIILVFSSCSSKSPDYFLARGRAINQEIISELNQITDLEMLVERLPVLQQHFSDLVEVMIEAKKWQIKHKTSWKPTVQDIEISQELANALVRIYEIPTARVLIEKCQEPALLALDTYEKRT